MGSADIRDDKPAAEPVLVLPPVDLDELALGLCVALEDARDAGAHFAGLLRAARPNATPAHLAAVARDVAGIAVEQSRARIGVRGVAAALQVDRPALWQAIREHFALGAELELMRSPA